PNVVFVLDNSTSMYELPYSVNTFPNSAWVSQGTTASATGGNTSTMNSSANLLSCHSNTYFEAQRDVNSGLAYTRSTTYAVPDPSFSTYFTNANIYKFIEWNSSSAGGTANGTDPTTPVGGGAALGTPTAACGNMSSTAGSGGSGGVGSNAWSLTQRQR